MSDSSSEELEKFANTSNLEIVSSAKIGGSKNEKENTVLIKGDKKETKEKEDKNDSVDDGKMNEEI